MHWTLSALKAFWRGMLDSRVLSFWFLHWVFGVVELQSLPGPLGFDILSCGIHKTQAHSKEFLHYYFTKNKCSCCQDWITVRTVLSSIITVKLQKQLGAFLSVQESYFSVAGYSEIVPRIISRPAPFHKKFVSLAVLFVLTVSVLFTTVFQVMTSYWLCLQNIGLA